MAKTSEEMVNIVKTLSGEENEETVKTYLELAKSKILRRAYPFSSDANEVPEKYEMIWAEFTVYLLNKRGAENESQHSENGVSRHYQSEDSLLREIIPFAGVLGGKKNETA